MAIKSKDIKLLWGRSGNRCAICKVLLTQDTLAVTASFTLGEQAHIVGEKEDAPRGGSVLNLEERDSYHNLILLCPTHHTEIDKNEADWPVERLHHVKSTHELWVTETLSETIDHVRLANQAVVSAMIDDAVRLCRLETWCSWTRRTLTPSQIWDEDMPDKVFQFRQRVISAVWPKEFDELRRSATTLSVLLHRAAQKFMEHSDCMDGYCKADRFYKRIPDNPNYHSDLERFEEWQDQCYYLIKEATKAANWFADVVRRDVNPMFFAVEGRFIVEEGPFTDLSYRTSVLEFSESERKHLPDSLLTAVDGGLAE